MNVGCEVNISSRKRQQEEEREAKKLGVTDEELLDVKLQEEDLADKENKQKQLRVYLEKVRTTLLAQHLRVLEAFEKDSQAVRAKRAGSKK